MGTLTDLKDTDKLVSADGGHSNGLGNGKVHGSRKLHFHEVPRHLQFNKYVLGHYRSPSDWKGCLSSLFYLHNETVNIVTHGLPALAILFSISQILPWDEIDVAYLPLIHVVSLTAPWVGSTLYHLFMNHRHGEPVYRGLLMGDMFGIWIAQAFGSLTPICATFYCYDDDHIRLIIAAYLGACAFSLYKVRRTDSLLQGL